MAYNYDSDSSDSSMGNHNDLILSAACQVMHNNNTLLDHCLDVQSNQTRHRGSVQGRKFVFRNREEADQQIQRDYFRGSQTYDENFFRLRYRMSSNLYHRIIAQVESHDKYFKQRRDATGRLGLSTIQKTTVVFRILAYGLPADATDEYIKIGKSTAIESCKCFCRAIVEIFSNDYLRSPNYNDIERLLYIGQQWGFSGMLGSLDCMHWRWKNCPTVWAGQYSGRSGKPSIILEAVADYDLWIWHAYFGMLGSNNDINVLESSHLFANLANGVAPPANVVIQGKQYDMGYYLADGIYPKWSTIVQTIRQPQGKKKQLFAERQEACRKDVERAFGVLQSKFGIVDGSVRYWDKDVLRDIIKTCIVLHNMIIEDERDLNAPIVEPWVIKPPTVELAVDEEAYFSEFLKRHKQIKDRVAHYELRNALIEHLWEQHDNS